MSNCRVSTLDKSVTLSKDDCPDTPEEIADILSNVPIGTRPDIAYAVGALSRFNANPGRVHCVFRYLQGI